MGEGLVWSHGAFLYDGVIRRIGCAGRKEAESGTQLKLGTAPLGRLKAGQLLVSDAPIHIISIFVGFP